MQETDLSLQKAIDMCRASEFSKRQTKSITEESKSVDYVNKNATRDGKFPPKEKNEKDRQKMSKSGPPNSCKICGTVHAPAFGKICQKCKNRNHFASQCLSKNVHFVESDQAAQPFVEDEQLEELFIDQVQKDDHKQEWKTSLQVNNNLVELLNVFRLLKYRSFRTYSEKKSKKIALHPLASKFGPQEVNRFSQSHTEFHAI